jgi:tRNA(fMet)-specific endonuclease VapC
MTTYMLDTNICSFIIDKEPRPSKRLAQWAPKHQVVISSLVYFEMREGALSPRAPKRLGAAIDAFVARLAGVVPWDTEAANGAAEIYVVLSPLGQRIGVIDTLIAGHALATESVLVTNNTREFERVKGLKLEDWS